MRIRTCALVVTLIAGLAPRGATADEPVRCGADAGERIRFIEDRLDQRRSYADWWWKGWTSAYGLGMVIQSVQAGLEDDEGRQADYAVSAAKAAFGTGRLFFFPPTARTGADPMRVVDPANECERLAVGEDLLRKTAHESRSRWSWKRHLSNVAINVAGGVIVAEGFDESRGWTSMGVGIAVGSLMTFTHPWKADDDLAEYERRFAGGPAADRVSLSITPWNQGARILVRF